MAKLKYMGQYIPHKDEPTYVGVVPTNKLPSRMKVAVKSQKPIQDKKSHED